jgi:hypothetical protein
MSFLFADYGTANAQEAAFPGGFGRFPGKGDQLSLVRIAADRGARP